MDRLPTATAEPAGLVERVRELIGRSGASQGDFARTIGLDDSKLSKALGGTRRFSSLDLANIADTQKVTVDWLLTGQQPVLALAARSAGGSARRAIEQADEIAELRENAALIGFPQPWRPVVVPIHGGRWVDQGQALAEVALQRVHEAGYDGTEADLPTVVEEVFGADVAVTPLGPDFDGLSVSSDDVKLILLAATTMPARQRFTLAHELGHLLAGDDQEMLHVDPDIDDSARRRDVTEVRANAFAAAFLMPAGAMAEAVGNHLDRPKFARLVGDRRVSPRALARRLADLRLIDAGGREEYQSMTTARAAHLGEWSHAFSQAVDAASRERAPGLLRSVLFDAYQAAETTLTPYARLLKVDEEMLRSALEESEERRPMPGAEKYADA